MTATYYDTNGGGLDNTEIDSNFRTTNWIKGAEQTASATMTLPAEANYFVVAGNTTISGINNVDGGDGVYGYVVRFRFSGTPTLTHGPGLLLNFQADMDMSVGDVATFVNESSGVWRMVGYSPSQTLGDIRVGTINATYYGTGTIATGVDGITQTNNANNTKVATNQYVDRLGTYANAAAGTPTNVSGAFDIDANLTKDTWETIGGTVAASSDHTISLMNNIALYDQWVELRISINASSSTSASCSTFLYAWNDGVAVPVKDANSLVAHVYIQGTTAGNIGSTIVTTTKVPCYFGNIKLLWDSTNTTSNEISIQVVGYGSNGRND